MRDLWHFHFYGDVPLALVKGRERTYLEHFWNDFAADRKHSVPEADRRLYARAYAQPGAMRAGFTERFAKVNGVRLRYLLGGQGSPVVLLHGYAETGHMWRPIMPVLAQRHTVIVPDLRGAGGSAKPAAGYDKKTMAVDIHELTSSLKLDRVTISLGLTRSLLRRQWSVVGRSGTPWIRRNSSAGMIRTTRPSPSRMVTGAAPSSSAARLRPAGFIDTSPFLVLSPL